MKLHFQPGDYKCVIKSWRLIQSKTKGTPGIEFWIEILEDAKGTPVDSTQQRVVNRWLTDGTIDRVVKELHAMGYDCDSFDELDPNHPNGFDFEGTEVKCNCRHEQFTKEDGQVLDKEVWEFRVIEESFNAAIDSSSLKSVNSKFGHLLKNNGKKDFQPARPAPTVASTANNSDLDDVF